MKNILLLSTGGTIASTESSDGLAPQLSGTQMIKMIPELEGICRIECREIMNLDSTNIQPEDWETIAREVYKALERYDGIVVTHGTDTMAYSASALSFMLPKLNKPLVFTGSQIPIENPHTDGKQNILDGFRVAAAGRPGVYIVFHGRVLAGVRARKLYTKKMDAFHSINAPDDGKIEAGKVIWNRERAGGEETPCSLKTGLEPRILLYKLVPGFNPALLQGAVQLGYRGIVLEAFGAGGVPGIRRNLQKAVEETVKAGVTVAVTTQCVYDGCDLSVYEVGKKAAEAGCLTGYDMTSEALCTKLMWVLGQTEQPQEIQRMMNTCYCGEFTETFLL